MIRKVIILFQHPIFYFFRTLRKIDNFLCIKFLKILQIFFNKNISSTIQQSSILFILENIGDTIRALPVLNYLSPEDNYVVCTKYNFEVLTLAGYKNLIIVNRDPGLFDFLNVYSKFRNKKFKNAIILDYTNIQNFSINLAKLISKKQIYKIFSEKNDFLESCPPEIDLLTYAKCIIVKDFFSNMDCLKKEFLIINNTTQDSMFKKYKDYIAIHIGGMGSIVYSVPRQYPIRYNIKIIEYLLNRGLKVLITGDNYDFQIYRNYLKSFEKNINFINLCGKLSLTELSILLKHVKAYITPDNGTLHLAQASKCKRIYAILGPTSPKLVQGKNTKIIRLNLECSPCLKFLSFPKKCINRKKFKCIEDLTPEKVIGELDL